MKHQVKLLFGLLILSSCSSTKKLFDKNTSEKISIFLCIGQSNMAGRADIEPKDTIISNRVFLFNEQSEWEIARNPLNRYSTLRKELSMQKLGPVWTFSKRISEALQGKKVGLIVNARGGSSIDEWQKGGKYYKETIIRAKEAQKTGIIKGIIWHQGESDANTYETYLPKLVNLIISLRKDLNNLKLPFIAGQTSNDKPHRNGFNEMLLELPEKLDFVSVVTSENTSTLDSTHFDTASQRIIGERYSKEMIKLLKY